MTRGIAIRRAGAAVTPARSELRWAGGLMVAGFVLNGLSTLFHPAGQEDDHRLIFAEYADSGAWVAVHLGQFVGVLLALAGLLVLYRAMRTSPGPRLLAHLAAAATVATAAAWALLQGLDGVGLKQAVDAWANASGTERSLRFANAETVRWLEWGLQSYFRVLLGLSLALYGAALLLYRTVAAWLGWAAVLLGLCSIAIGVDVGYNGLASGLQDLLGLAFLVVVAAFSLGVLASGVRGHAGHAS